MQSIVSMHATASVRLNVNSSRALHKIVHLGHHNPATVRTMHHLMHEHNVNYLVFLSMYF